MANTVDKMLKHGTIEYGRIVVITLGMLLGSMFFRFVTVYAYVVSLTISR